MALHPLTIFQLRYVLSTFLHALHTPLIDSSCRQISIPVSSANGKWVAAEILREEFLHSISTMEPVALIGSSTQLEALLHVDFYCLRSLSPLEGVLPAKGP